MPCRVACFGKEGAYAHIAARSIFDEAKIEFFPTFADTAAALLNDDSFDYAVMPVENSTAGSVLEVYDILINNPLYICLLYTSIFSFLAFLAFGRAILRLGNTGREIIKP